MSGGRPTKPLALVKGHRTKEEKKVREKAEKNLLTGVTLKEWPEVRSDPDAHKEFLRIKKVLKAIDKDDALHEGVINRYCQLLSECKYLEQMKLQCNADIVEISQALTNRQINFLSYMDRKQAIQQNYLTLDKQLMNKRKMMLDIEKENIMTIQSALRSIPKKPVEKKKSGMAAFLEKRQAGNNAP